MGFSHSFIIWILNYISSTYFYLLINDLTSPLLKEGRGIRKGCPLSLSPLIFILVVESLSYLISNVLTIKIAT
jgi:hypothetical protein